MKCVLVAVFVLFLTGSVLAKAPAYEEDESYEDFQDEPLEEPEVDEDTDENVATADEKPQRSRDTVSADSENEYDDDEFVGQSGPQPKIIPPKETSSGVPEKENFYLEYCAIVFIIAYFVNFIAGKRANETIAQAWFSSYRTMFEAQFAQVGISEAERGLIKDSQSAFQLYATGRRNCSWLLATINLRKRQDLFGLALSVLDLSTSQDSITITVSMNDTEMEPFVFAIVRKRQQKRLRKTFKDLENYSGVVKTSRLQDSLTILSDCPELERDFVDDSVIRTLRDCDEFFELMHFSDQYVSQNSTSNTGKRVLHFQFRLPTDMEQIKPLMKMVFYFIDQVGTKRLSAQAHASAISKRKLVAEQLRKANNAQNKENNPRRKEDKKRSDASTTELTEAQLRKKEAKEQNKAKRRMHRIKVLR